MRKKLTLIGVFFVLTISLITIVYAATTDKNAPVLKSVSFKTDETSDIGDKVYLNLDIYDDVSGISSVTAILYRESIFDEKLYLNIYDIDSNPYFIVPENATNGTYCIGRLFAVDNANNSKGYFATSSERPINWFSEDEIIEGTHCFNVKTDKEQAPLDLSISNVSLSKTKVSKGESVDIYAQVPADPEKVRQFSGYFINKTTDNRYFFDLYYDSNLKKYVGNFEPKSNGVYELEQLYTVSVYDDSSYLIDNNIKFTAIGFEDDIKSPTLKNVSIGNDKYGIPSYVDIEVEATDDISGLTETAWISFIEVNSNGTYNNDNRLGGYLYYNKDTDRYEGDIDINQYNKEGLYKLESVYLIDNSGNYISYTIDSLQIESDPKHSTKLNSEVMFELENTIKYDIVTSTVAKDCLEKIKKSKDDAIIAIDSSVDPVVKKEIFEAIKNTNRVIYIESNGIQWVFKGKDVTNPKDIDTSIIIYEIENYKNATLKKMLKKAIVIEFADNGDLPGVSLVRIKADYALRNYLGRNNLYAYYFDELDKNLDQVSNKIYLTSDNYYEFSIDHNSSYAISTEKADDSYVSDNQDLLNLNSEAVEKTSGKSNHKLNTNLIIISSGIIAILVVLIVVLIVLKKKKIIGKSKTKNRL